MKKKELLNMRKLGATPTIINSAKQDELKKRSSWWYGDGKGYNIGMYLRCAAERDTLKVAIFLTEHLRAGGNLPAYEVYLDRRNEDFITYDCLNSRWLNAKLDMLPWPTYVKNSTHKWMNEQSHMLVKNFLGTKQGGYGGIFEYQLKVREEQLKRKHKRETDPWDLELSQTQELPKDWEHWVRKVGIPDNYIFYRYEKKGAKKGYCSYCEKEVPIKEPRHNKYGVCPKCGHNIQFKAIGRMGTFESKNADMYLIQRIDSGFMIRSFTGSVRYYRGDYLNPHYYWHEVRRALYNRKAAPVSAYYWGVYKQRQTRWMKGSICGPRGWGWDVGAIYGKTMPSLYKKELLPTGLQELVKQMKRTDPERYLANYIRVPQLEQMLKADLKALVRECFKDCDKYREFFAGTRETSLIKAMGIDAPRLRRLRESGQGLLYLKWLRYEKSVNGNYDDAMVLWFCQEGIEPKELSFISNQMSMVQIYNYIQRQMRENKEKSRWVINTWADYLSMAKRLKLDTTDSIIYRVRKLKQRHDELVERSKEMEAELWLEECKEKFPHIGEIYQRIAPLYSYEAKDYMVVVPSGIEDIIEEGARLNHCVGKSDRYLERIENESSYVLFLRRTKDPEKPYYTLEVEPDGTVRQKRTMYDRQEKDIEQAKEFLRNWQRVVAGRITGTERKMAAKSKELREKEFLELKKNSIRIWTPGFHGRPLLDVLMEDLMENTNVAAEPVLAAAA